jgi:hypothetical protein
MQMGKKQTNNNNHIHTANNLHRRGYGSSRGWLAAIHAFFAYQVARQRCEMPDAVFTACVCEQRHVVTSLIITRWVYPQHCVPRTSFSHRERSGHVICTSAESRVGLEVTASAAGSRLSHEREHFLTSSGLANRLHLRVVHGLCSLKQRSPVLPRGRKKSV